MKKLSPKKSGNVVCSFDGCENPVNDKVLGLCSYHLENLVGRKNNIGGQ